MTEPTSDPPTRATDEDLALLRRHADALASGSSTGVGQQLAAAVHRVLAEVGEGRAAPRGGDETHTARDVIRAVVYEWGDIDMQSHDWTGGDDLVERIDRALFELPEDQERALEQWAADEVAARQRTRTALAELEAEVPRALYRTPLGEVMGRGVMVAEVPLIAALLREPAAQPEGTHREE